MKINTYFSGSSGNLSKLSDGHTEILFDCGVSMLNIKKALNFELTRIKATLITHEHKDHSKGVNSFVERGMTCISSAGTFEALGIDSPFAIGLNKKDDGEYPSINIGTLIIKPFAIVHDAVEPVGFFVYSKITKERVVYLTDTGAIPVRFNNLNYLMIEINYSLEEIQKRYLGDEVVFALYKKVRRTHLEESQVLDYLKSINLAYLKELHILHRSQGNSGDTDVLKKKLLDIIPRKTKLFLT